MFGKIMVVRRNAKCVKLAMANKKRYSLAGTRHTIIELIMHFTAMQVGTRKDLSKIMRC
jgi:hypothetical protein